nr:MAG TPA: hypothetical protein [Caudoviricetes sp.]
MIILKYLFIIVNEEVGAIDGVNSSNPTKNFLR